MAEDQSSKIREAAKIILGADYLLVGTGAGMSADSGLPVYRDTQKVEAYIKRKLSYMDLCTPKWNFDEPETFYGFWGESMTTFRNAVPHEGYTILKKWRDQLSSCSSDAFLELLQGHPKLEGCTDLPGPFFVYTSNVDALHLKSGFRPQEIAEIHGNIETWQCSNKCTKETWSAPRDFNFKVDLTTMLAHKGEEEAILDFKQNNGFVSNHPRCKNCGDHARPAILMFGDWNWARNKTSWNAWRASVDDILSANKSLSLAIVEIGCGKNVPSVRCMGEQMLDYAPKQCKLIRINNDFIKPDFTLNRDGVLGIQGRGLPILQAIDAEMQNILKEEASASPVASLPKLPELPKDIVDEELAHELRLKATLEEKVVV